MTIQEATAQSADRLRTSTQQIQDALYQLAITEPNDAEGVEKSADEILVQIRGMYFSLDLIRTNVEDVRAKFGQKEKKVSFTKAEALAKWQNALKDLQAAARAVDKVQSKGEAKTS